MVWAACLDVDFGEGGGGGINDDLEEGGGVVSAMVI